MTICPECSAPMEKSEDGVESCSGCGKRTDEGLYDSMEMFCERFGIPLPQWAKMQ
jgi:predicted amidophosphoribosyltransferase